MFTIDYIYRSPIDRIKTTRLENWMAMNPNRTVNRLTTIWEFIRFLKSETGGGWSRLAEFLCTNRDSELVQLLAEHDYGWWPLEDQDNSWYDEDGEYHEDFQHEYSHYFEPSDKVLRDILVPILGEKFYMEFYEDELKYIPTEYRRRWNQFKKLKRLQMHRIRRVYGTRDRYTRKDIRRNRRAKKYIVQGILPKKTAYVYDRVKYELDKSWEELKASSTPWGDTL